MQRGRPSILEGKLAATTAGEPYKRQASQEGRGRKKEGRTPPLGCSQIAPSSISIWTAPRRSLGSHQGEFEDRRRSARRWRRQPPAARARAPSLLSRLGFFPPTPIRPARAPESSRQAKYRLPSHLQATGLSSPAT
jgi:hypothetical protein